MLRTCSDVTAPHCITRMIWSLRQRLCLSLWNWNLTKNELTTLQTWQWVEWRFVSDVNPAAKTGRELMCRVGWHEPDCQVVDCWWQTAHIVRLYMSRWTQTHFLSDIPFTQLLLPYYSLSLNTCLLLVLIGQWRNLDHRPIITIRIPACLHSPPIGSFYFAYCICENIVQTLILVIKCRT